MSEKKWSYVWLILGAFLLYFSNWNWALAPAAWLFPVFLVRFSRTRGKGKGLLAVALVCIIAGIASMWRLLPIDAIPPVFRVASGFAVGIIFSLPFVADRLIAPRVSSPFVATLVFPSSWTALEYLKSLGNGSWGALAYTQADNLPFMQLASITGIWGLSFLITWFGAVVNCAWEQRFDWPRFRKIVLCYGLIIVAVFLYGHGRLATGSDATETVCIASVTNPRDFFSRFYGPDWTDRKAGHEQMLSDLDYFLDATRRSAGDGAKIVFWQEYALVVMEEDEQELIGRAGELATQEHIFIVLAIGLFPTDYPAHLWQNKLIWIAPSGKVIHEYQKSKPAPPLEPIVPGQGVISVLDTPYGRIASVICADLDYPSLVHQAGAKNADILLISAQDWPAVDPLHSNMAVFRAIENGLSMVKGTGGGMSIAVDPYGRTIATSDPSSSKQNGMIACLSAQRVVTLYAKIGDVFAWLCILGLTVILIWSYLKNALQNHDNRT